MTRIVRRPAARGQQESEAQERAAGGRSGEGSPAQGDPAALGRGRHRWREQDGDEGRKNEITTRNLTELPGRDGLASESGL